MNKSIYPLAPLSLNLPLNIFGVGFEENQSHIVRKEGFHVHQFFLCTGGEGLILMENREIKIKEGDFYFLPAGLPHEYFSSKEKWNLWWVAFYADEKLIQSSGLNNFAFYTSHKTQNFDSSFKKIFALIKNETDSNKFQAASVLFEMISEIYAEQNKKSDISKSEKKVIENAVSFINEKYNVYFTIDELAESCSVSPQYLCRIFQKNFQMRPFQYLALKRVQKAKELLQNTSLPVSEIAHKTGYEDFSYFCSIFKKLEGISPTQFRGLN